MVSMEASVVAEMIAGSEGIGSYVMTMQFAMRAADMYAAIFLLAAVGLALCGAMLANKLSLGIAVASVLAIIIFTFSFVSTEIALYMLIFSMLLGPQLTVGGGDEIAAARKATLSASGIAGQIAR